MEARFVNKYLLSCSYKFSVYDEYNMTAASSSGGVPDNSDDRAPYLNNDDV